MVIGMWQGSYVKEPFDLRLAVLRLISQIHIILGVTLLGMLLFGGGYYVKNVLLYTEELYEANSVYHVEYAVEAEAEIGTVYINQTSWNTYVQSELFLEAVQGHLGSKLNLDNAALEACIEAKLASDLRMPSTVVTTDDAQKSLLIAQAVEAAMEQEIAEAIREIDSVSVVDRADIAEEVIPDVRVGRAFALSGILSLFFVVVILLMKETWEDSVWLPGTIYKRYGLKTAGTIKSRELGESLKYFFGEMRSVALCPVGEEINPAESLEEVRNVVSEVVEEKWFSVPAPLLCPEACESLRKADGVLLLVKAGAPVGKELELNIEFLEQQDCKVMAALLVGADERLIKWYYFGRRK